jgi:pimeloyl-ACP methyl ester carboxylesterase
MKLNGYLQEEKIEFMSQGQKVVGSIIKNPRGLYVIMLHGYRSNRGNKNSKFYKLGKGLSDEGIGSLRFDFRSPKGDKINMGKKQNRENKIVDSDEAERTITNMLYDTESALGLVKELGSTNIGLVGSSLGSWPTLFGTTRLADKYGIKAVATWAGGSHYNKSRFQKSDPGRDTLVKDIEKYDITEIKKIRDMSIPHLIIHGAQDEIIPISDGDPYTLSGLTGGEVSIYDGAGHGFPPELENEMLIETRNFFRKYI